MDKSWPARQGEAKASEGAIHSKSVANPDDYDRAALILQHGDLPEDFLLAHEFWVVAISKGKNDKETLSLAAASEDRYLMNIGHQQRFGTQLRSDGNGPIYLYPVDSGVTDDLRRLMGVHPLAEIKAKVAEMNKK